MFTKIPQKYPNDSGGDNESESDTKISSKIFQECHGSSVLAQFDPRRIIMIRAVMDNLDFADNLQLGLLLLSRVN